MAMAREIAAAVTGKTADDLRRWKGVSFRPTLTPACYACVQDEIYDRTGRHPRAAVRVEINREPYVLRLCEPHLAQLTKVLPSPGMRVVERYHAASTH